MNKEELKQSQPIVYQTLSNALRQDNIAHAYLFYGPKGTPKSEVAILLAQSLVCRHTDADGFACQECEDCQRIKQEESIDFKWVHGDVDKIKKKDIVDLKNFFVETSAGQANQRIYILDAFDQATTESSNALLKFLEEPQPGIYGILTVDERSNILPTIQSRCQNIPFRPAMRKQMIDQLSEQYETKSATMLVDAGYTLNAAETLLADETFDMIQNSAIDYVHEWKEDESIVWMQTEIFPSKGKNTKKEWVRLWLEWVLFLVKNNESDATMQQAVSIQLILVDALDALRTPVDLALLLDKVYTRIRKVVNV